MPPTSHYNTKAHQALAGIHDGISAADAQFIASTAQTMALLDIAAAVRELSASVQRPDCHSNDIVPPAGDRRLDTQGDTRR